MPDKKLTDSEINTALMCCNTSDCSGCPYNKYNIPEWSCMPKLRADALDLINRQDEENESLKAEVERLQNAYKQCAWERDIFAEDMKEEIKKDCSYLMLDIKTIKAEAYKEFAEKSEKEIFIKQEDERKQMLKILKTYRGTRTYSDTEQATDNWLRGYGEAVQDILGVFDNILKELVGDSEEPPKPNWQDSMINTFLGGKQ